MPDGVVGMASSVFHSFVDLCKDWDFHSGLTFRVTTPWILVAGHQRFGTTYCFRFQSWRCMQYLLTKRWYLPDVLHGVINRKTENNTTVDIRTNQTCLQRWIIRRLVNIEVARPRKKMFVGKFKVLFQNLPGKDGGKPLGWNLRELSSLKYGCQMTVTFSVCYIYKIKLRKRTTSNTGLILV
jgi:hypothetical protein